MRELVELAEHGDDFARRGVRLFAVSHDDIDAKELQEELGTNVTLLTDADGSAARAFNMMDTGRFRAKDKLMRSGTFYIDRDGRVHERWLATNYRKRPDPEAILATLRP